MTEQRYAGRIRQALNHGLQDISPAASRRLEAARHLALSRQKAPAVGLVLSGAAQRAHHFSLGGDHHRYLRHVLSVLALLAGMWIAFYWHSTEYINELEATDSALLADDLPPEAFLDNDFTEWLKNSSPAQ